MKKFCLLLLAFSVNTFANTDKWNGTYHYYSSEELPGGNVVTIEFILKVKFVQKLNFGTKTNLKIVGF